MIRKDEKKTKKKVTTSDPYILLAGTLMDIIIR